MTEVRPTITIKLKPYLQDYLRGRLNDRLSADSKNVIGAYIKPFLECRPKTTTPVFSDDPAYITFELPFYHSLNTRNHSIYVSETNQAHFQAILESHFKDLFYQYMNDKIRYDILVDNKRVRRGQIKNVILQFCSDYDIPFNNMNYELLQKAYYRKRQKMGMKTNLFSSVLSLTCPLIFLIP